VSWFSAVPEIVVCVAIMFLPGLPVTYLLGLRGVAAWAVAPVIPITVASIGAIVAPSLGIRLSIWVLLVPSVVIALVVGAIAFLLRRRYPARTPDPRAITYSVLAGLGFALAVGLVTTKWSITRPDNFAATFDAVFHHHVLAYIQDTGNGSALSIGGLGIEGVKPAFYPAAWHDLAGILQNLTGTGIPVAANVITIVISLLIWPLGCILLARQLFGPARLPIAVTGALSLAFPAFPWTLMGYGTLWPNILGLALVPAGLAVVMSIAGLAKEDVIGRGRAWLIAPVLLAATVLAHPNALFSLVVLAVPILATWLFIWVRDQQRAGRLVRGLVIAAVLVVGAAVLAYLINSLPVVNGIKTTRWRATENMSQAVGEVLLNATNHKAAAWLLSIVVVIGIISCIRQKSRRWLVAGHLLSAALFVMAAGIADDYTAKFTGFWYNDSWRLAAMVPITGVPLAAIGVLAITAAIKNRADALTSVKLPDQARSRTTVAAVVVVAFTVVTFGFYADEKGAFVRDSYAQLDGALGDRKLITPDKLALMQDAQRIVPPDALVAASPWTGATALWPLMDRKLLIPNLDPSVMTPDQAYLARYLVLARGNPQACELISRLNVQYLMTGPVGMTGPDDHRLPHFRGLGEPSDPRDFQLVAQRGESKLFKITACDSARP
jgi:hypothetical protein